MKSREKVRIKKYQSGNITQSEINDFIIIQNQVFANNKFNVDKFNRKYKNNIYGDSIIVLAYYENKCIGARAFWRNDIEGNISYQPCDTAVLLEYRSLGVFKKMTLEALDGIEEDSVIYNFPNDMSLKGYQSLDWQIKESMRYKIASIKDIKQLNTIEDSYFQWLVSSKKTDFNEDIYYYQIFDTYVLLKRRKANLFLSVGVISKENARALKKARLPVLLVYSLKGYFGRGVTIVTKNSSNKLSIPLYKMDTLF